MWLRLLKIKIKDRIEEINEEVIINSQDISCIKFVERRNFNDNSSEYGLKVYYRNGEYTDYEDICFTTDKSYILRTADKIWKLLSEKNKNISVEERFFYEGDIVSDYQIFIEPVLVIDID